MDLLAVNGKQVNGVKEDETQRKWRAWRREGMSDSWRVRFHEADKEGMEEDVSIRAVQGEARE